MKANDVERAAGTRSSIGLTCKLAARAATIGIATIVVAALEVQFVLYVQFAAEAASSHSEYQRSRVAT